MENETGKWRSETAVARTRLKRRDWDEARALSLSVVPDNYSSVVHVQYYGHTLLHVVWGVTNIDKVMGLWIANIIRVLQHLL